MTVAADSRALDALGNTAGEMIGAGAQMLQIRSEKQVVIARQRPRDEKDAAAKLNAEAADAGDDFFYSIPFKDHAVGCTNRKGCSCPVTKVEGAGVGLARSAVRLWGNCNIDVMLEQDTPDAWIVGAWFIDFETNYTRHEVKRVSKMKALKGGRVVRAADREMDMLYQVGASKVERDVVLRALPRHYIERAFELAKMAALMDKQPVAEQVARLVRRYGEIGIGLGALEAYVGCPLTEAGLKAAGKDARDTCSHLRGMLTAIKGGDLDPAEVFAAPGGVVTTGAPAAVRAEDLDAGANDPGGERSGAAEPSAGAAAVGGGAPATWPVPARPTNTTHPITADGTRYHEATGEILEGPTPLAMAVVREANEAITRTPADEMVTPVSWPQVLAAAERAKAKRGKDLVKEAPRGSGRWWTVAPDMGDGVKIYDAAQGGICAGPAVMAAVMETLEAIARG